MMVFSIPWVEYYSSTGTVLESGSDIVPLFDASLAIHLYATDQLVFELGASVQNHVYNRAFGTGTSDGDGEVSFDTFGAVPYVGLNYIDDSGFFVSAQVMAPLGFAPLDVLPIGGALGLGAQLGELYER
jgi:hypothetical protein